MGHYLVTVSDTPIEINADALDELDAISQGNNSYHVIADQKAYRANIVSADGKQLSVNINGNLHEITIADVNDQMVKAMGLLEASAQKINDVQAPMPGLIVSIKVSPGQTIAKDDQLLVLSAMKMENIILAAGEGVVKSIHVKEGEAVDKGQVIIEME
ncbi:MAG: biotin/lipoyl-containing protein [Bacteroidota bacterium]